MTNDLKTIKKQASNIDERGNVLYLDEERLNRKNSEKAPYKNRPNGLGIWNAFKKLVSAKKYNWKYILVLYKIFVRFSSWLSAGGLKRKIYRKIARLDPPMTSHTSTIVLPLNVDITDAAERVVVPMDIIKDTLKQMDYIAGMDTCLCREGNDCEDYPKDLACLFFGECGRAVVKNGIARQFTYEEACARVEKAAEYGLMGHAVWVEMEQILWGVKNDHMDRFLEICFCCPCCCIGMQLAYAGTSEDRKMFHPSGWTAVPDRTLCNGCRKCDPVVNGCPMKAISFEEDGKVTINQETCVGCGICKTKCEKEVIKIKQTMPMRKDLHEYFLKDHNIDLKLWDN